MRTKHVGLPDVGASGRAAVRVTAPFEAMLLIGTAVGNTYIGASMALRNIWLRVTALPGDEVHVLPGGVFLIPAGADVMFEVTRSLSPSHVFERSSAHDVIWPTESLEMISPRTAYPARVPDDERLSIKTFEGTKALGEITYEGGMSDVVVSSFAPAVAATLAAPIRAIYERGTGDR